MQVRRELCVGEDVAAATSASGEEVESVEELPDTSAYGGGAVYKRLELTLESMWRRSRRWGGGGGGGGGAAAGEVEAAAEEDDAGRVGSRWGGGRC